MPPERIMMLFSLYRISSQISAYDLVNNDNLILNMHNENRRRPLIWTASVFIMFVLVH